MRFCAAGALLVAALGSPWLAQARQVPSAPTYAVLDETGALPESLKASLQRLLTEHDHVSDEQVVLAIFSSSDGESPEAFTRLVFNAWKIGDRGKDNGVLLTIFIKERQAAMMAGAGQEDPLGEAERKSILDTKVLPELSRGDAVRAAGLGVLETLKALKSPLVGEGRAERELRAGGFTGAFSAREWTGEPTLGLHGGWLLFLAGIALLAATLFFVTAAEAHFTNGGWFRPSPWRWARWKHELMNSKAARKELGGARGDW